MTSRPILFSAPMVRALLNGSKTQTRRAVKPQPDAWTGGTTLVKFTPDDQRLGRLGVAIRCPYGQPGDELWVREAWRIAGDSDGDTLDMFDRDDVQYRADDDQSYIDKYRPSIHMPRRFSRITLRITDVRVERLQDISDADVIAEGVPRWPLGYRVEVSGAPKHESRSFDRSEQAYRWLWESINGQGSWDANPWVWVVEFRRLPTNQRESA
jgi:hypothetical protein